MAKDGANHLKSRPLNLPTAGSKQWRLIKLPAIYYSVGTMAEMIQMNNRFNIWRRDSIEEARSHGEEYTGFKPDLPYRISCLIFRINNIQRASDFPGPLFWADIP